MKTRLCAAFLLAAFCVTLFTGCASVNALKQSPVLPEITISTRPLPRNAAPDPTPAATPAATGPSRPQPQYISKEDAKTIALTHAGLSATDVTWLKAEFDYDDGRPEYDVAFRLGGYKYDYEIHAETGTIITWDKDREN